MWRAHFVVLGSLPAEAGLARLADGFHLFREARTGLHFLTPWHDPPTRRPNFSGFADHLGTGSIDLTAVEQALFRQDKGLAIAPHEFSRDLIHAAAWLAGQLGQAVLVAEDTDDEYGMAVQVEDGQVRYLRLRTTHAGSGEPVEATWRPDTGLTVEPAGGGDIYSVAQAAISDLFGQTGISLSRFAESKPTRQQAESMAAQLPASVQAHLDSFGVFKRVAEAPPRSTASGRLRVALRKAASYALAPFLLTGMLVFVLVRSGRKGPDPVPGARILCLIGLATLALPVLLAVLLLRLASG